MNEGKHILFEDGYGPYFAHHRGDEYEKEWRRFQRRAKKGAALMAAFGHRVDWRMPMEFENPKLDQRPVGKDTVGADQGVGQQAAVIDGSAMIRRNIQHDEVDHLIAELPRLRRSLGEAAEEYVLFAAADIESMEIPDDIDPDVMAQAEVVDLMSQRLPKKPAPCNAAPLGDLWGEQLAWRDTAVELLPDGSVQFWTGRGKDRKAMTGVPSGHQLRLVRWAKAHGFRLNLDAPKVTRKNRNHDRQVIAADSAIEAVLRMIDDAEVPPFKGGKGRPSIHSVVLSTLGTLGVELCSEWAGKYSPTEVVLDRLAVRGSSIETLISN